MAEPVADAEWATALRQAWGRLEITNAVMYSKKRKAPTEEQQRVITAAMGTLRHILNARAPNRLCLTTAELLRRAAFQGHVSSDRAEQLYQAMRQLGYRGPEKLWQP